MARLLSNTSTVTPANGVRDLARVASAIQATWRNGKTPDAAAALEADKQLATDRPLAIDLAYDEYCLREQAGEVIEPRAFARRFTFCSSLLRLIQIHGLLNQHPDLVPPARPTVQHQPGDRVGDYEIIRLLGRGGFANVYLVSEHSAGHRGVVLKLSGRNEHEAGTLAPLSHPHLMLVYSAPCLNGMRTMVMPFYGATTAERLVTQFSLHRTSIRGQDVLREIGANTRPGDPAITPSPAFPIRPNDRYPDVVRAIAGGVAAALAYLHNRHVTHRDIKPENILLGNTGHPYLLDFNLAVNEIGSERVGGTLPYLAPEVLGMLTNESPNTATDLDWAAADVYSFGVVVWELLTGQHPYLSGVRLRTVSGQMRQAGMVKECLKRFHADSLVRRLPVRGKIWRQIERCLEARPANRPSAIELARLLSQQPRQFPKFVAAACAASCVAGGIAFLALSRNQQPTAEIVPLLAQVDDASASAIRLYHEGKFREAGNEFAKLSLTNPNAKAYSSAAYCYAHARMCQEALALIEQAKANQCDSVSCHVTAAYCHFQIADMERSSIECERALQLDPNCQPALLSRVRIALRSTRRIKQPMNRSLINDFERATANRLVPSDVWLDGARLYLLVSERTNADLDRAVQAIQRAVQQGVSTESFNLSPLFNADLKRHPGYQAALQTPTVPMLKVGNPFLGEPPF
jgi:eukaryotic-like serine/threonine-protein kinase